MKKFGKFVLGVAAISAVAGGVYLLIKKSQEKEELDFEETDDDLEDDIFDDDLEDELSRDLNNRSTDEKDYINISVEVPAKEETPETPETPAAEPEKTTPSVTPITTETI